MLVDHVNEFIIFLNMKLSDNIPVKRIASSLAPGNWPLSLSIGFAIKNLQPIKKVYN